MKDSAESKAIEAEVTGEPEVENPAEPAKEVVKGKFYCH